MTIIKNVTVTRDFFDGTLAEVFQRLDYPAIWKAGQRRDLPEEVVKRVQVSGGIITFADAGAKESQIVKGAEPTKPDPEYLTKLYGKGKRVRVVFPKGFRDGSLADEFAAIGHPSEFGWGEIIDLPFGLLEKVKASGALVETDPETIAQTANQQGKHQLKVRQWQEQQAQAKAELEANQQRAAKNKDIQAEIEQLSAEYITATGNEKAALWTKIRELKLSLS